MAIKLFLALVALIGLMWFFGWYHRAAPAQRNRALRGILLYGIGAIILLLVLTGRLPWLFAIISAAIPWINRALTARRVWQMFNEYKKRPGASRDGNAARAAAPMSIAEAYQVLGLAPGASEQEIIEAHRKLMQRNHPDRGGSDYLARRINQAKEVLLKAL